MQTELKDKYNELSQFSSNWIDFKVSEEYIAATKYDIQVFLGLLDQEVPNVQLLNSVASKYISKLSINRETKRIYLTLNLTYGNQIMYEKMLISEWI